MVIGIDIRNIGKKRTGDEVVFFNLVKNLAEIDQDNHYLLFTDITNQEILETIKKDLNISDKNNFQIISLKTKNKFSWNFWTLPQYLRKNPVDIYLTQYITPWFVPKKIKIITIIHDVNYLVYPRSINIIDWFFMKTLIPVSIRRSSKVLGVSKFTRDEIIKYYKTKGNKTDYIYNAVSNDFLRQDISAEKIAIVRKKYNLPDKYVLYLGTLQPRKNIPILIEAFRAYLSSKDTQDNMKLVLVGGKAHNYDQKIDELIKKYNLEEKIVLPGFIDEEDKAAVMAGAQVFCFPSLYEGFGIPILEAMSVGAPVVASAIDPHKEVAGEAALFFDPSSLEALAKILAELATNQKMREHLIEKGKEQVQKFSWKNTAERMRDIFLGLK